MTREDILERLRAEMEANGGHVRPAAKKVAGWIGSNTNRLKAFWEQFGHMAIYDLEQRHQTDIRTNEPDDSHDLPENHGIDGRAVAIEEGGGPMNRWVAMNGKRIRLGELTGEEAMEHGRQYVQHGKAVVQTGKRWMEIGEVAGERKLVEAWGELEEEHRAFLRRRTEPIGEVA